MWNEALSHPEQVSVFLKLLVLVGLLSVLPALVLTLTCFTRVVVVLSFLRHGLGTHQTPPNQVIVGLSLFLTFFIMSPVWTRVDQEALRPYLQGRLGPKAALRKAFAPLREFMLRQTREEDLALFYRCAGLRRPRGPEEVPPRVLIPAFVLGELRTAFQIGFLLYLPFLVVDLVISSILLSMGMLMLPPVVISLPFKILLFVLVDGWNLVVGSLVRSFA